MKRNKKWLWAGIATVIFAITFVFHDKAVYFGNESARHILKGLLQAEVFTLIGLLAGLWIALAGAVMYWIIFDAVYNKVTLKKSIFYVGRTAQIDVFFRRIFGNLAGGAMFAIKIILLTFLIIKILNNENCFQRDDNPTFNTTYSTICA